MLPTNEWLLNNCSELSNKFDSINKIKNLNKLINLFVKYEPINVVTSFNSY